MIESTKGYGGYLLENQAIIALKRYVLILEA